MLPEGFLLGCRTAQRSPLFAEILANYADLDALLPLETASSG